jgi:hypothetical protein
MVRIVIDRQRHRRVQPGADAELANHPCVSVGDPARAARSGAVGLVGEDEPLFSEPAAELGFICRRCSISRATVAASVEIRRLWWVFVSLMIAARLAR